ncbi:MAG: DNA-binding protein YbiB [Aquabacterium sp.]|jgi:anthranilate phosphoribosyltransferase|uniref:DNA-binding protein YbiB n=1 Tax=Aquabacterium sp. TaxID=1872578 RepID=UPI002A35AA7D|nr:DNA-binding protein YbiB [Aquabacterium sp.]MDX9845299.1 DNA-binding protein YbiB [Aquabacterium sp.]
MSIAAYIKVIGRGKDGARPLDADQSADLMGQVLDAQVSDLEVGAFCLAMRIKGETAQELQGFMRATHARCLPLEEASQVAVQGGRGIVVLPSYNGARKLPNLTALLAASLAQRGVNVLVHGPAKDPTRVTTAEVFEQARLPRVSSDHDLARAWQAGQPAFMDIAHLCAPLAKLLAVRWTIGLRNPGHTVAKLLNPFDAHAAQGVRSMQVVNHTHPEYAHSLTDYLQLAQAHALLMRGTEGEPVADARRQPRFDVFLNGQRHAALSRAPEEGVLVDLPELPYGHGAAETAAYLNDVMCGRKPLPASVAAQADCLVESLSTLAVS